MVTASSPLCKVPAGLCAFYAFNQMMMLTGVTDMKSFGGSEEMIKMMESPLMTFMSKGWLIVYIVLAVCFWPIGKPAATIKREFAVFAAWMLATLVWLMPSMIKLGMGTAGNMIPYLVINGGAALCSIFAIVKMEDDKDGLMGE